jgi:hypothetical protein
MMASGNAAAWALACSFFERAGPTIESALSDAERDALALLVELKAVKPARFDARFVLCPYCQLHRGSVVQGGTGLMCNCPDCGPVSIDKPDTRAWLLDTDWLIRKLRGALDIPAQQGTVAVVSDMWRLGAYQRSPVVLARTVDQVLQQPSLIGRTRGTSLPWLITPKPLRDIDHDPVAGVATWLPLEERFTLYGDNINFVASGAAVDDVAMDTTEAVNGPFSADFRWVHLPGDQPGPIALSAAQAAVFSALWHFGGQEQEAHIIMSRAGRSSDKPIDVFKVKTKNKGDPKYEAPLRAYKALVKTNQRAGTYAMPCAALSPA